MFNTCIYCGTNLEEGYGMVCDDCSTRILSGLTLSREKDEDVIITVAFKDSSRKIYNHMQLRELIVDLETLYNELTAFQKISPGHFTKKE